MSVLQTVLTSTLTKSRKKLMMASIKSCALHAWAFSAGRVDYEDGGWEITNPLTIGRNPTISSYEYYQPTNVQQTDEFTTVRYRWSRIQGSVIISDQEEDENRGQAQIFKLMKAKMEVLEESIREKFSEYMYTAQIGTNPLGLPNLVPEDPTVGVLGGLDRATETQWRASSYDFAGTLDSTNIEEAYDDILMDLNLKGDRPDVIICGRNQLRNYRAAARDKIIINLGENMTGKKLVDLGFGGVQHQNVPMIYDEDCPVNLAYFVNSKYLRLTILRHVNMRVKNLIAPWTVDAAGKRIVWQGQWCLWNAYRKHAVVND